MSDQRTPGLLSLLPEDAEERLKQLVLRTLGDQEGSDAEIFAAAVDVTLGELELPYPDEASGPIAYLLVLLIEQAKRCEALEDGLRPFATESADEFYRFYPNDEPLPAGMMRVSHADVGLTVGDLRTAARLLENR